MKAETAAAIEFPDVADVADVAELVGFVDGIRAAAQDQAECYQMVGGYPSVTRLQDAAESLDAVGRRYQETAHDLYAALDEFQRRAREAVDELRDGNSRSAPAG